MDIKISRHQDVKTKIITIEKGKNTKDFIVLRKYLTHYWWTRDFKKWRVTNDELRVGDNFDIKALGDIKISRHQDVKTKN